MRRLEYALRIRRTLVRLKCVFPREDGEGQEEGNEAGKVTETL